MDFLFFKNCRQSACYSGVDPFEYSSGKSLFLSSFPKLRVVYAFLND